MKKLVKFPEVLFFQEGPGVRNTQYTSDGVKLLNVANLVNGRVDLSTSDRFISRHEAYGKYKHFLCDDGDFIIASSGIKVEYVDKKMGFVDGSMLPLCMNTSTIRFKVLNNKELNIRYFMYYLKSKHFKAQLGKQITGSAQLNYGPSHLKDMTLPMTDISIQNNIVNILDKIQNIINISEIRLEKLDKLVKARFVEMFGEPVSNPKEWPIHQLMEYIEFLTSGSRGWAKYFTDDGEYFITIKNVKNCRITVDDVQHILPPDNAEAKRTKVQEGDLLISITADLGRTGVVDREIAEHGGYINQHLTCIRFDKKQLNSLYVAYYMESDAGKMQFQAKNQSSVKSGLNFNSINSLRLMVPPLRLQNDFVKFVAQIDKSKVEVQKALDEAQLLFDCLMQKYIVNVFLNTKRFWINKTLRISCQGEIFII